MERIERKARVSPSKYIIKPFIEALIENGFKLFVGVLAGIAICGFIAIPLRIFKPENLLEAITLPIGTITIYLNACSSAGRAIVGACTFTLAACSFAAGLKVGAATLAAVSLINLIMVAIPKPLPSSEE